MKAKISGILFAILLAAGLVSCEKETTGPETEILGLWLLTERTMNNAPDSLSACELLNTLEFRENNMCVIYDACAESQTNSGWNFKFDMLNISRHLPAAYYIDQLDTASLTIRRNDIGNDGELMVTVLVYTRQEQD